MSVIDWTDHEWTEADSDALDEWAASNPNRLPLTPDPVLWELLAPLRDLPLCSKCDRPMRPKGTTVAQYPGSVHQQGAQDHCNTCYVRERKGPRVRMKMPTHCLSCERPLRSHRQRREDKPGTVLYRGSGLCMTCGKRGSR